MHKLLLNLVLVNLLFFVYPARHIGFKLFDFFNPMFEVTYDTEIAIHLEAFLLKLFVHASEELFVGFLFLRKGFGPVAKFLFVVYNDFLSFRMG